MIPAKFDYVAPTSVEDALSALSEHGDDAKIMAGGQSLLPVLRMRLNAPEVVIDLGRIESLRGVREDGDALVIGALTTHSEIVTNDLVRQHALLLSKAAAEVADNQIRHRGTFGGSCAHADPAGDMGSAALAMDAEFVIAGPGGTRSVAATEFFVDLFETAIGEDEILTEIRVPKKTGWGAHYEKFVRVAHQWPIVAVAATVNASGGTISRGPRRVDQHGVDAVAGVGDRVGARGSGGHGGRRTRRGRAGRRRHEPAQRPERRQRLPQASRHRPRAAGCAEGGRRVAPSTRAVRGHAPGGPGSPAAHASEEASPRMDLEHTFTVPVGVDTAWAEFQDIASVAECFPGATVTGVEGDTFNGSVKVKLGPIALVYNGSGTFTEKDDADHRFVVDAKGKDKRGNGTAGAKVTLTMNGNGDSTEVKVVTDLAITGKPAQFGRGVMQDVSDKLLGQFVACLEQRLGNTAEGAPAAAPTPAEPAQPAESATPSGTRGACSTRGAGPTGRRTHGEPGRARGRRVRSRRSGHTPARRHPAVDAGPRLRRRARPGQDRPAGPAEGLLEAGRAGPRGHRRDHLAPRALTVSSSAAALGTPFTPSGRRGSR